MCYYEGHIVDSTWLLTTCNSQLIRECVTNYSKSLFVVFHSQEVTAMAPVGMFGHFCIKVHMISKLYHLIIFNIWKIHFLPGAITNDLNLILKNTVIIAFFSDIHT